MDSPYNDFHQLDTCDECGSSMDHWRTKLEDGGGGYYYYLEWICTNDEKCGIREDRIESVEEIESNNFQVIEKPENS